MSPQDVERKLAAILSADVVGYSRLMAEDEAGTIRTLTDYREVIATLIRQHRGRVVDSPGDNLLAEFPSALDAVHCAIEIQRVVTARNADLSEERKMEFRIGVHLGDVMVEGERIYGDGVNIAARLEGLAEPSGICISATVQEQVRRKLELTYEDLGEQEVKNIPEPVHVYGVRIGGFPAGPAIRSRPRRYAILSGLAVLVAALGAVVIARYFGSPSSRWDGAESPPFSGRRFAISLPDSAPLSFVGEGQLGIGRTALDLSPDGRLLAYVGMTTGGGTRLYLRPLDRFEVRPLAGTEGAYAPFFSPDSRWIGFFADDQLKKVSVLGGKPIALAEAANPTFGAWWNQDRIFFAANEGGRLLWVPASGGAPTELEMRLEGPQAAGALLVHSAPQLLPGGKHFLFSNQWHDSFVYSFESGLVVGILQGATSPRYVADGTLLFARGSDLMAVAFDPERLAVVSDPTLVAEGVRVESGGAAQFAVAGTGWLAFAPGAHALEGSLAMVGLDGDVETLPFPKGIFSQMTFSPGGEFVAIGVREVTWDIRILDLRRGTWKRVTREGNNRWPAWSSDGNRLYFSSDRGASATLDIYSIPTHEARTPTAVLQDAADLWVEAISKDGTLLITRFRRGDANLYRLPPGEKDALVPFAERAGALEALAHFSPDDRWVAYSSDETGPYEVYVAPATGKGGRIRVSAGGGEEPVWSPSGDRIYFRNGPTLMTVPIRVQGSSISAGEARPLFDDPAWINLQGYSYQISRDGTEFVMVRSEQELTTSEIRMVQGSQASGALWPR